ncbi:unnamed protein product, partial [Candidula unifasciata]
EMHLLLTPSQVKVILMLSTVPTWSPCQACLHSASMHLFVMSCILWSDLEVILL